MAKYLLNRILRGILSLIAVVAIVMIMVYSLLDRRTVLATDGTYSHMHDNSKKVYEFQKFEEYGYLDYVTYADYMKSLLKNGEITNEEYDSCITFGDKASEDSQQVKEYVDKFTALYKSKGYTVERLDAHYKVPVARRMLKEGGNPQIFAHKDIPVLIRLWNYLTGIIRVDNIHYAKGDIKDSDRGLSFTWFDPVYGGKKFSPAIMGNGTKYKYLLYFDNKFPFIHQNLVTLSLGMSYSCNEGVDVFDTMIDTQGRDVEGEMHYPSGITEPGVYDLHTLTYIAGSYQALPKNRSNLYVDDYTSATHMRSSMSKMGYSFKIGIIAVILSYLIAIPLGIYMARRKDKLFDKIGTAYIVFIMAVPSLAYIFMFKAVGVALGLPATFDISSNDWRMFALPIICLALPSIAGLMRWLRRYMIDQMNSDYVRFARSGGLSEKEIFRKHILKNAIIPIVHGIPANILGALVGAIITERVFVVPGAGNLLMNAINAYDNGVIVGVTLFYAFLSVSSVILGDVLMSMVDPRISFTAKER